MIEVEENTDYSKDLFEHYQFHADKGQEPLRVDKFLMNRIENATRNKIQIAAKNGFIFVNGESVKSNYKVKGNDVVRVLFAPYLRKNKCAPPGSRLGIQKLRPMCS